MDIQNGIVTLENRLAVSHSLEYSPIIYLVIQLLGICQREIKTYVYTKIYSNVHNSLFRRAKITNVYQLWKKQIMVYPYNEIAIKKNYQYKQQE